MYFTEFKNLISVAFKNEVNLDLSDDECEKFFTFMNLLIEKNKVMNLTAITEPKEIIYRHFLDSSILLKFYPRNEFDNKKIIDIGTGAGFPGLPLSILLGNTKFVLSDTLGKRIAFLNEVVNSTRLKNVELVKARAEDLANDKSYRESFDYVVSRGVAKISTLSEYTISFVKLGGSSLFYKMFECDEELKNGNNAINILGGMFHVKQKYSIISGEPNRAIIEIKKIKTTPKMYPRKAGTPQKNPL